MATHPPTQETRKYMNQTLSAIQTLAKIEEFNQLIHVLQLSTNNEQLLIALDERPRSRTNIVTALQQFSSVTFTVDEVWDLVNYYGDFSIGIDEEVPVVANAKLQNSSKARQLLSLYAELMGASVVKTEHGEFIDWTADTFIDEITV